MADLEEQLRRRIVGQEHVLAAVARAVRGWVSPSRAEGPAMGFLFLGPVHVGKTLLARSLAELLFGSKDAFTRLDMGEYAARAVDGDLTAAVRSRPRQVVLLDEVHKARPDALDVLRRLLRDGQLMSAGGRVASFRDTLLVMTSTTSPGGRSPSSLSSLRDVAETVTFSLLTAAQNDRVAQMMRRRTP